MNWKQLDVVLVMIFISSTICLQVFIAVWDFDSVQVSKKMIFLDKFAIPQPVSPLDYRNVLYIFKEIKTNEISFYITKFLRKDY